MTTPAPHSMADDLAGIVSRFVGEIVSLRTELRGNHSLIRALGGALKLNCPMRPRSVAQEMKALGMHGKGARVLDVGCGNAPHRRTLEWFGYAWSGLDWAESVDPAALKRAGTPTDAEVVRYDGRHIPFGDGSFEAVWSWQAMEHFRRPDDVLSEIRRCLARGGVFAGSTSFLEPYHAQSAFGYSPIGFKELCDCHGFKLVSFYPQDDALLLFVKKLAGTLGIPCERLAEADLMAPFRAVFADRAELLVGALAQIAGTFRFVAQASDAIPAQ